MLRSLAALSALLALTACAVRAPARGMSAGAEVELLTSDGRDIAEAQCSGCHAVGEYGESPNPIAPTFRTVLSRYPVGVLEEELIAGIRVAHPMPQFQFNPRGAEALMVYLRSIQEPAPQTQP